jgi:hypothetical protein
MTASFNWPPPLDPYEIKDYKYKLTKELTAAADTLQVGTPSSVTWILSSVATTAGLLIHASSFDSAEMTVWLKVNPAQASAGMFDPPGTRLELSFTAVTTGGRTYHRTGSVLVQKL